MASEVATSARIETGAQPEICLHKILTTTTSCNAEVKSFPLQKELIELQIAHLRLLDAVWFDVSSSKR
jgi:hypothetical protein